MIIWRILDIGAVFCYALVLLLGAEMDVRCGALPSDTIARVQDADSPVLLDDNFDDVFVECF